MRNKVFDLSRFASALAIMFFHMDYLGWDNHPYMAGNVFCEYFFMLYGFFLANHFRKQTIEKALICKNTFYYVLKRYVGYLKYTIPSTIATYIFVLIGYNGSKEGLFLNSKIIISLIREMLLLKSGDTKGNIILNGPLWFLVTTIICLPVFCILIQTSKKLTVMVCSISTVFLYLRYEIIGEVLFPNNVLRAFAAISMGIIIKYISNLLLQKFVIGKKESVVFCGIQVICMGFPILWLFSKTSGIWMILISFIIAILLASLCNEQSCFELINGKVAYHLAQISLPMFLWQFAVIYFLKLFSLDLMIKCVLYFVLTIMISEVNMYVVKVLDSRVNGKFQI